MAKLKPLLPSLREKKRYLAFEVIVKEQSLFSEGNNIKKSRFRHISKKQISWLDIKIAVKEAIHKHIGRTGLADAGILFVKNNSNKAVLRTSNNTLNKVKASLIFIKKINNDSVIVRTITASGVLNKAVACIEG
ncbi:hypothetical protein COV16_01880 [Candidatus Woesearchaeota archaeon CG10_big_fil_rev_8_21_14_0_10_34_8]|nr:MAG: hypothetical protein COV16_01880 [Candidatus Woesearchaeota archaeon CG10_big_fil_rev_8_21_14_0_10_34_8]